MPTSPLLLGKLPPEIRSMILKLLVFTESGRSIPNIIVALRCQRDQTMYFHALTLFYTGNTFFFDILALEECPMPKLAARTIRDVFIVFHIDSYEVFRNTDRVDSIPMPSPYRNIKVLKVYLHEEDLLAEWVKKILTTCKNIQRLNIFDLSTEYPSQRLDIDNINRVLGIDAKLSWVTTTNRWRAWFWEAPRKMPLRVITEVDLTGKH